MQSMLKPFEGVYDTMKVMKSNEREVKKLFAFIWKPIAVKIIAVFIIFTIFLNYSNVSLLLGNDG